MNRRALQAMVAAAAIAAVCGCNSDPASSDGTGGSTTGAGAGGPGAGPGNGSAATGATGATSSGAGGAPAGKVPIFIAEGSAGRTTISCDGGHTWVADHSWDIDGDPLMCGQVQTARCYENDCLYEINDQCVQMQCCNDSPDVAKGVIYGDGKFVATWGWGQPGAIRTSDNGVDWTTTHGNDSFGGLAYGSGHFVAASRFPFYSADGDTWTAGETADFKNDDGSDMWSVRRFAYSDFGGGRFIAQASGNTNRDMLISSDGGDTWWRPSVLPDDCAGSISQYGGIVSGNGIIVIVDQESNACRSTDGGDTWSVVPTGLTQVLSHGVWTGSEFWFWGDDDTRISSPDGVTWTKTPMATPHRLGPVAIGDDGTLVATGNVWEGYDQLSFFRSTDGLTWEELPAGAFAPSHSIFYIAFGYAEPSAECPLP